MSNIAIRVEGLGKRYRIGQRQQHDTLRDALVSTFERLNVQTLKRSNMETFWALKDVSFEVKHGEVVGIIGRNGAGKSTLLKILARITEPTEGYADLYGRVGSLLEVGTGFHPELTGRENISLSGALLGMKKAEIARKFDEIVAFAEIEKFIDTPVKHYSSGMYVRLAFAVAAHLEPEILLVDEVLAVGDAAFQKKCLGKMGDVAKEGRTVLFVSHDMTNISVLCRSVMLLECGQMRIQAVPNTVIESYLRSNISRRASVEWSTERAPGDDVVRITRIQVGHNDKGHADSYSLSEPIRLIIEFKVLHDNYRLNPVFVVKNNAGVVVFSTANYEEPAWRSAQFKQGCYRTQALVPGYVLNDGTYFVDALLVQETRFVRASVEQAVEFSVYDDGSTRGDYLGQWVGVVRPRCIWHTEQI